MILDTLQALEKTSKVRGIPIIGRERGQWLYEFIQDKQPQQILELGTANGYSGIILCSAGATLHTVEQHEGLAAEAKENFTSFNAQATVVNAEGLDYLKKLEKEQQRFDLIFIDFSKRKYLPALASCIALCMNNGYIIADNIFFPQCQDFKKAILMHPQLTTTIIPIGNDGFSCSHVSKDNNL